MSEWQKCPVCNGTGLVSHPPGVAADQPYSGNSAGPWACKRCEGTGTIPRPVEKLREKVKAAIMPLIVNYGADMGDQTDEEMANEYAAKIIHVIGGTR